MLRLPLAAFAVMLLTVSASAQPSSTADQASAAQPAPSAATGASAGGAETPDQALNRIIGKVKEKHSMVAVIDDVDWDAAYQLFPVERHNTIINVPKVTGPDDLKAYFEEVFGDPKVRTQKTKARLIEDAKNKGTSTEAASGMVEALEMAFERSHLTIQATIDMSSFKTGEVKADGDKAQVQLVTTRQGMTTVKEVMLVKKGGRWLLAEPSLISTRGQKMVLPEGLGQSIGSSLAPGNANSPAANSSASQPKESGATEKGPAENGATTGAGPANSGAPAASTGSI